ncbi:DNA alkylation repair protein [Candidatus Berkelbacteria bacterium CG10_big_fil_rev_8_21_14_0_10_43_13]|uniref:DNA alkylation repair protein n=1 Tax=Candidatus Berkelbacteria bacterium CG10_big_fil_rev_8_21_14_0_10_43_13 TaxID=1974514 RepID=A0A2H0W938_9BACT|nr:MAG: DNA alkylation repair protein [Candidatus Berkelbacteria bacterium CG10_big_fil_rev_8_21_14_0_10_43_13]
MTAEEIIAQLKTYESAKNREGMARFGITGENVLGGPNLPTLRKIAKEIGRNHELALELWNSGIHEARMLAVFIDEPDKVTEKQLDDWAADFDSWDICDQTCSNLFDKTDFAYRKAFELVKREEEFVRRTGFVIITALSVHDKKMADEEFVKFFPMIKKYATDERNFVKKAVNWCLRQIGKRNKELNKKAIKLAEEIKQIDSKSARWIAADALRELNNKKFGL